MNGVVINFNCKTCHIAMQHGSAETDQRLIIKNTLYKLIQISGNFFGKIAKIIIKMYFHKRLKVVKN
jgi:hypothetical protein